MKCKRIFKVASALALTVALLVSSAVVSFAAKYTTTTTYLNQSTIEVTSTASGLAEGAMATYVAYNNDGFNEANAVYIDQATANGTDDVTFTYQTSSDNVKATVKFGGSTETEATKAEFEGWTVNVKVDNGAAVPTKVAKKAAEYADEYLVREIEAVIPTGKAVAAVALNGAPIEAWYAKAGSIFVCTPALADGDEIAITTEDAAAEVVLGTVKSDAANTVTAFAKATCAQDADYGILIGGEAKLEGAVAWDAADNYATAVKLPALGMGNDGGFCVEVEDSAFAKGTFKVAAYAGTAVSATKDVTVK